MAICSIIACQGTYDFPFCFKYSLIKSVNCLLTSDFLVLFISLSENMNAMCRN